VPVGRGRPGVHGDPSSRSRGWGLRGDAVIAGIAEYPPERKFRGERRFTLEQWADLAALALDDAGLSSQDVNGLCCSTLRVSETFVPSTVAEYLGWKVNVAERLDLGGATPIGMVWRAAAAIELGLCDLVVCAAPSRPTPSLGAHVPRTWSSFGASSNITGSPQAEFDIPYGRLAQNGGYAMIANRYAAEFGYDPRATAKSAAEQRANACATPGAVFHNQVGYDPSRLRPRGGRRRMGSAPAEVVPVRLDPELRAALEARASAEQTSTSEIIREALRRSPEVA
jgi:acetyl-CoA C-acetyltransferase